MKVAAGKTRPSQAQNVRQMLVIALTGWPPETATVLITTALHWGLIR